jgi:H+/Cl- antiporter ClcA
MTVRGVAKRVARIIVYALLGAAVGVLLGAVAMWRSWRWLHSDPHRWYMIVLFALVCCVSGAWYGFRKPAQELAFTDTGDPV